MQKQLLDIARDIYAKKGAKISVSEIANIGKVTRPTVYKHLGDKAQILARLTSAQNQPLEPKNIDERIMRGVLSVVKSHGFKSASVDAIARTSGVGPATIYRRFKDKDGLIKAFIGTHTPRNKIPVFPNHSSEDFDAQLAIIVSSMLRFMSENRILVGLVFSGNQEDRAYLQTLRDQSNTTFSRINIFFQRHQTNGTIGTDISAENLTVNLFGMVHAQAVISPIGNELDIDLVTRSICQLILSIKIGA